MMRGLQYLHDDLWNAHRAGSFDDVAETVGRIHEALPERVEPESETDGDLADIAEIAMYLYGNTYGFPHDVVTALLGRITARSAAADRLIKFMRQGEYGD